MKGGGLGRIAHWPAAFRLARLTDSALSFPRLWIGGFLAASLVFGMALPGLQFRTEGSALYPIANDVVDETQRDQEVFGDAPHLILLVASRPEGPPVASPAGFRYLREIPAQLLRSTEVPLRVRSLASRLEVYRDSESSPRVRVSLSQIPQQPEAFQERVSELRTDPLTGGLFLSPDGRLAALYISTRTPGERHDLIPPIEGWLEKEKGGPFELTLTGPLMAEARLGRSVLRDLLVFVPLMAALIAVLLWLSLRMIAGVVIPLVEVLAVLLWTLGTMSLLGIPVTLVTTILPVVLMAMAIADEIHLLERVEAILWERGTDGLDRGSLLKAVRSALGSIGRPIVLTSLTTALGFLSFLTASIKPLQDFGIMAALGILLAMGFTFTLVPAVMALLPLGCFKPLGRPLRLGLSTGLTKRLAAGAERGGRGWLVVLFLLIAALPGLARLSIQDSWIGNFDPDSELVRADRIYNENFWGSYRFDVVFDAQPSFFRSLEGVKWIERFKRIAEDGPKVGGTVSHLIPFAGVADFLGFTAPLAALPDEKIGDIGGKAESLAPLIDLRQFLTSDGASARVQLFVNNPDYADGVQLREYLERELTQIASSSEVRHRFAGDVPVAIEVVRSIVANQLRSITFVVLAVGLLLFLVFGSLRRAAALLFPAVASVLLVLAVMGYAGASLGVATSMFAAMTVGVGVDFAVHFADAHQRARRAGLTHGEAVGTAFQTSGRAIGWNALTLSVGLLVLTFSALRPNHSLGLLLAGGIALCYCTTLTFLPRWLLSPSGLRPAEHAERRI